MSKEDTEAFLELLKEATVRNGAEFTLRETANIGIDLGLGLRDVTWARNQLRSYLLENGWRFDFAVGLFAQRSYQEKP